jgi:uncharacterized membrane protein YcaP (DUF421 family)
MYPSAHLTDNRRLILWINSGSIIMWKLGTLSWIELIERAVIVYVFLLVILRITGKRQVGQLAPFDLVLLLILSNALQNAINGGENSLSGGFISATTLIAMNYCVGWLTFRSKKLEGLIEGRPVILVHDGHINHDCMKECQMTMHELDAALRAQGHAGPEHVRFAVLENNGQLTVIGANRH